MEISCEYEPSPAVSSTSSIQLWSSITTCFRYESSIVGSYVYHKSQEQVSPVPRQSDSNIANKSKLANNTEG